MKHQQTARTMVKFPIAEIFESINGEGKRAGELALFIRFAGCNLNCSYCDTSWAIEPSSVKKEYELGELIDVINSSRLNNITITGGEPLLQSNLEVLIKEIPEGMNVEIETNGSQSIEKIKKIRENLSITMDYKLPGSNMEDKMNLSNFEFLDNRDSVKFVVGSTTDLDKAKVIMSKFNLLEKATVFLSSEFNSIKPKEVVEYMKLNKLTGVKFQLQLHKYIWDPQLQGV